MLIPKKSLLVIKAASTDSSRPGLAGVHITKDGAGVATDGHILFKYTPMVVNDEGEEAPSTPDSKDYPAIDGINFTDETALEPFTLSADSVQTLLKALPKKSCLPILSNVALDTKATNDNGSALIAVTDLETSQVFKPTKVENKYPDYEKVIPDGQPKMVVGFMVEKLIKALQTMKALDIKTFAMEITDPQSAVKLTPQGEIEGKTIGVIMPVLLK